MNLFLKKAETHINEPLKNSVDPRLKNIIKPWDDKYEDEQITDIALLGVPFDEAIIAGVGRGGAKDGPAAIRKAIKNFGTTWFLDEEIDITSLRVIDYGDLEIVEGDTIKTHERLSSTVKYFLEKDILPITLGGGHDLSFATIRALSETSQKEIGGINVDAHFDVRPVKDGVISSGTPFRRALEDLKGKFPGDRFVEMGMTGNSNSKEHHSYLKKSGTTIINLKELRQDGLEAAMEKALEKVGHQAFFSIDIDAIQQAYAPGCSTPAPIGLTVEEITELAFLAGKASNIKLFDLMEVNPHYDYDGRTARLAASIISCFLAGYVLRLKQV